MVILTGWRYVAFVSTIVGVTGAALYPIIIQPLIDPSYYRKFLHSSSNIILYMYPNVDMLFRNTAKENPSRPEAGRHSARK